ncbi:MAG: hypothetical protein LBG05_01780 [Treponema sp.]|jgi:hypothetical protein|nr:hypothetical protein [Treponema sp.]
MTLRERNLFFKAGIAIAALAIVGLAAASAVVFHIRPGVFSSLIDKASGRGGVIGAYFGHIWDYAAFASMIGSVCYALFALIFIYRFFEKTKAPEILFFVFFVISFAFEACRIIIPLKEANELPSIYLIMSGRILFFGRYFGLFSLFMSSIYASGFNVQQQKNNILILLAVSFVFALEMPIDGFSWTSSLSMANGYPRLFGMAELGIILITLTTFFIAALSRGSKDYIFVGLGAVAVFIGRGFLVNADTWFTPCAGLLLLSFGTWLICIRLHSVYLWF